MESNLNEKRKKAAAELTRLLCNNEAFSFVKIGDGDLDWLLKTQNNQRVDRYEYQPQAGVSCELVRGVIGLEMRHYRRLVESLEQCSFLDFGNNVPFIKDNLPKLKLDRSPELAKNDSADTANIMFEWTCFELKKLCC